jgi:hypothetical protein
MKREPSCTNNHDVMRRELRDKGMPPTPCPTCGWILKAAREEPSKLLSDRIDGFMYWLSWETEWADNWTEEIRTEVHKKLIEFLT